MFWLNIIGLFLAASLGGYAAYWALNLRRSLRVRAYSRQVLIVGAFSVYGTALYFLFYIVYFLAPSLQSGPVGTIQEALYLVLSPLTFAWADSSIRIGRRLDPLLRDPLRWSTLRLILWSFIFLGVAGYLLQGNLSVIGLSSYGVIGVSVFPILIAAKRSGDQNYHRSLEWFGFAVALLVIQNLGFSAFINLTGAGIVYSLTGFIWLVFANLAIIPAIFYGVYKCARSLTPLNRISLES